MFHFIACGLFVLRLVFAADFAKLDSPRFDERRAATKRLYNAWPLSAEAARHFADTTDSPEARIRAEHVNDGRFGKLCARATPEIWDEVAWAIVKDPCEGDAGLPWEANWHTCEFEGWIGLNEAVIRLVDKAIDEGWLTEDHRYIGEVWQFWPGEMVPGYATGLSDLRFRYRGLPTAGEFLNSTGWHPHSFKALGAIWRAKKGVMAAMGLEPR